MTDSRSAWQREVDETFFGGEPFEVRQRRIHDERRERWLQEVRINPAPVLLDRLCRTARNQGLRGMLHQGDLYWWQAYYATHNDAMHWLKTAGGKIAVGVELHLYDDGKVGLSAFDAATLATALAHPSLRGAFDDTGSLIASATKM